MTQAVSTQSSRKQTPPVTMQAMQWFFGTFGRIAPTPTSHLANHLWFSPRRAKQPDRERSWEAPATRENLTWRARAITTYRWGTVGPVVLLVHGWAGRGTQLGAFAQPLVEQGYQVVAFDAPAHGRSPGKKTTGEDFREIVNLIEDREGGIHSLIAHSFGCAVSAYALAKGMQVEKAVFISPPSDLHFAMESFRQTLKMPSTMVPHLRRRAEETLPHLGVNLWRALSVTNNVAGFPFPGLIIHDREDHWVPIEEGRRVAKAWPTCEWHETRGLGHHRILREETVIEKVTSFLV
ncbi:alpha/beta hydrolase [Acanthopleuribacter pedis]|uniref:Alpha/beta hydrolase n=1 Tax=Acanthopleuribacter pedis TaxID=442870 RepID=A0A8J7U603_9BACT|nr:alpha/beta hydrolase [Acanthopleuribacter pedis]MBO1319836.1 alpha/beta hydrolase [Acanthopleuribacter pedis]